MTLSFSTASGVQWKFDGNTMDDKNFYQSTLMGSPTFVESGIDGDEKCLYLNSSDRQWLRIDASHNFDLAISSFTFSLWFRAYPWNNNLSFPSCDSSLIGHCVAEQTQRCLHYALRNQRPYMGFYAADTGGNTVIQLYRWYHVSDHPNRGNCMCFGIESD
jgi:hypothetical protein